VLPADPDSVDARQPHVYWPALDGVRAVAVALVVAFHLGYLRGGWIGVDLFFVLSGFLITSILLAEGEGGRSISIGRFWARRARRLLPGVLLLLVFVGVYAWAGGPGIVAAQLRAPALATLLYGANWQEIAAGHSYFAQVSSPDPLNQTWSLAVEEQYYLCWPLVVAAALWLRRHCGRPSDRVLLAATSTLAAASALWMGVAAHWYGFNRAYLGTDTRTWELLIGGAVALILSRCPSRRLSRRGRATGAAAPLAAAVVVALAVAAGGGPPEWMWNGGLVGVAVAALVVLVGVVQVPTGPLARLLASAPLRWLGRLSYSLYLWHWPVIVLVSQPDSGLSGAGLLTVRLVLMAGATCSSYYLVERPLRRLDWGSWLRRTAAPAAFLGTAAVLVAGTTAPAAAGTAAVRPVPPVASLPLDLSLPAGRVPSPSDPLRVWILGDSVMHDSSPGVTAALQATGEVKVVADSSFGGWGLTTDKLWPGDGEAIIRQYHPEVVIGTWSWDDPLAEADPVAYQARLEATLADLLAPGNGVDGVVLLQFPTTGPYPLYPTPQAERSAWIQTLIGEDAWDSVAQKAVMAFPGRAVYVADSALFAPRNRFLVWMKTPSGLWLRARMIDDIHVCPYGAAEFGAFLLAQLSPALDLGPPAAEWQSGSWTSDPRYNDPSGSCPGDHPPGPYRGLALPALTARNGPAPS
jgi:peptidoglycan/LPS O-acetylase OafA/YrhL